MDVSIGSTLAELRKEKKLMQKDVAGRLNEFGHKVKAKTIYNWEKDISQPNIEQFLDLCTIFGVDDIHWRFCGVHKGFYGGLNNEGRMKAREFVDLLFQVEKYRDDPDLDTEPLRLLPLYDIPVSAGTGNFLDDSGYEMIQVPRYVPSSADFALRLVGDSMEPLYKEGQIIWVKWQQTLHSGEIGIFIYNGDVLCKELVTDGKTARLHSHNPSYDDIQVKEDYGFRVVGKVV